MKNVSAETLRSEATSLVREAETMIRTKKDIDPYVMCMNCKHAIFKYLNSYLLSNDTVPNPVQSISVLMEQCKTIDEDFIQLDLSAINCKYELMTQDNCTDSPNLEKCLDVVLSIKNLIASKLED